MSNENIFCCVFFFFFKQKTAYEIGWCDWSSDVCSSDLEAEQVHGLERLPDGEHERRPRVGEEGRKPGEADEHHHRSQPVLRTLPPADQTAPDIGPADDQGEHRRGSRRAPLAVAPEH